MTGRNEINEIFPLTFSFHYLLLNIKIRLAPRSHLGKWSAGLIICFFVFLGIFFIFAGLGEKGGGAFFHNLKLAIPILLAGISGVGSFFAGLIGIIKDKEYSIFVFLATLTGLFVLLCILGEILFPH